MLLQGFKISFLRVALGAEIMVDTWITEVDIQLWRNNSEKIYGFLAFFIFKEINFN